MTLSDTDGGKDIKIVSPSHSKWEYINTSYKHYNSDNWVRCRASTNLKRPKPVLQQFPQRQSYTSRLQLHIGCTFVLAKSMRPCEPWLTHSYMLLCRKVVFAGSEDRITSGFHFEGPTPHMYCMHNI